MAPPLIDADLVRRLVAGQFPPWADLPIAPVASAGTDNALFRLGEAMCVRLPRQDWAVGQVGKEQRWLPVLAPHLPIAIPTPLAHGAPAEGYPWDWSVYDWLPGAAPGPAACLDVQAARDLAGFLTALQRIDAADGPRPGAHNFGRGIRLAKRDAPTRDAIAAVADEIDAPAALALWDAALAAPLWAEPPVWIHGDLHPGNLLIDDAGRITAVIDFGGLGVGDPACDLMAGWMGFEGEALAVFLAAMAPDPATLARGRGWTISNAAIALASYRDTNLALAGAARRWIGIAGA
jgi:aminoglycoside phosphotransferase (APT) family kinase protein